MIDTNDFYVDIHLHPTLKPFLVKELHSPWHANNHVPLSQRLRRSMRVTQSDFSTLLEGGVRVIWHSLHTLERYTLSKLITSPRIMSQFLKMDIERLRQIVSCRPIRILQEELSYLKENLKCPDGEAEAVIVKNYDELIQTLASPNKLAIILTIEGAHNLGFEYVDNTFPHAGQKVNITNTILEGAEELSEALIQERVRFMKQNHIFMLTLNHFVFNQLASMPKAIELTGISKRILHNPIRSLDSLGKYRGLTFLGYSMVERCMENNIIIDLKHCDAVTRHQIYAIAARYQKPVVGSHIACSGRKTNFRAHTLLKKTEDTFEDRQKSEIFNPWDLNFHDDDIVAIHKLGGLLGLILDRRVLSSVKAFELAKRTGNWLQLLFNQIEHIYKVLLAAGIPPAQAFDSICIGSDYDGFIEPLPNVTHSAEFRYKEERDGKTLRLDNGLVDYFTRNYAIYQDSGLNPETIKNKILRDNAMEFLKKHFCS
ncbi:MAG: membrane dipeptidase [Bacteroidia bacterium]|nr:membrane dipeptidase [Bacteroidia bacterium]MDW8158367.1 membrane dipeptidase [Bacteroidia bacterium]